MKSWLIPINNEKFNIDGQFKKQSFTEIHKNINCEMDDFAYIYCTKEQAIKYKCLIKKINIPYEDTIDDREYVLDEDYFKEKKQHKKYMKLELFDEIYIGLKTIQDNGFKYLNGQKEIRGKFLEYLNEYLNDDIETGESLNNNLTITERNQLSVTRIGQGIFRERVIDIDNCCHITGVKDIELLIASHIKPWKDSDSNERLDGNNGLLLSPHIDKLFDKYLISFDDEGKIMVFNENVKEVLQKWSIDLNKSYFTFSPKRKEYLTYHRKKCEEKE